MRRIGCVVKAYKITILVLDHDEIGRDGIVNAVERTKYPNRCIAPSVQDIEEAEIGEWHDDHAMNHHSTRRGEYQRIFAPAPGEGSEVKLLRSDCGNELVKLFVDDEMIARCNSDETHYWVCALVSKLSPGATYEEVEGDPYEDEDEDGTNDVED